MVRRFSSELGMSGRESSTARKVAESRSIHVSTDAVNPAVGRSCAEGDDTPQISVGAREDAGRGMQPVVPATAMSAIR